MTRSSWKGPFIDVALYKKIQQNVRKNQKEKIKVWSRGSMIIPTCIGLSFEIYNGKRFTNLYVSEDMVGHKFGEFALTRKIHKYKDKEKNK